MKINENNHEISQLIPLIRAQFMFAFIKYLNWFDTFCLALNSKQAVLYALYIKFAFSFTTIYHNGRKIIIAVSAYKGIPCIANLALIIHAWILSYIHNAELEICNVVACKNVVKWIFCRILTFSIIWQTFSLLFWNMSVYNDISIKGYTYM